FIGLARGHLDAFLGAGVDVLDHLAVGGGELIEFVQAVANGLRLALNVLLAREWVDPAPEPFAGGGLKRLASSAGGAGILVGSCGAALRGRGLRTGLRARRGLSRCRLHGGLILGRGSGLLREGRQRDYNGQEQRNY